MRVLVALLNPHLAGKTVGLTGTGGGVMGGVLGGRTGGLTGGNGCG